MSRSAAPALRLFVQCLKKVPDPRSKKGTSHPLHKLKKFRRFGKIKGTVKVPCDHTLFRVMKKTLSRR